MPVPLDTRKRFSFSHLERQVPPVQQDVPGRSQEVSDDKEWALELSAGKQALYQPEVQ